MKIHRFTGTIALALAAMLGSALSSGGATTLIPTNAVWKYLDNGSDQGTAWRAPAFDDSAWASGAAQLGYGDGDEATPINGGPVGDRYITTYFRRAFVVSGAALVTNLSARILYDDGAVVYLNGVEAFRVVMPAGAIGFRTPAASAFTEDAVSISNIPPALLVEGTNMLAVEVHQGSTNSQDVSFSLQLQAGAQPDTDNDGMPDTWEVLFGLNPSDPSDAVTDPDGDGFLNRDEYNADTDPTDAQSYLRLNALTLMFNDVGVQIATRPGLTYGVQRTDSLDDPQWSDFAVVTAVGANASVTDVSGALRLRRFYRVWGARGTNAPRAYSVNLLGYASITVPAGSSFVSVPFFTANHTVSALIPFAEEGLCVVKAGSAPNCFEFGQWADPGMTLNRGETFEVQSPVPDFVLTFVGEAAGRPVVIEQPANRTVAAGGHTTFTVATVGEIPLRHQWFFNRTNAVSGATNATFTLTNLRVTDAGRYSVVVSNAVGMVSSMEAVLSVSYYFAPPGGWTYLYTGHAAAGAPRRQNQTALDGTWRHENGSDEWNGDRRGPANLPPGGVETRNGVLTIEDAVPTTSGLNNNRKIYFTHGMTQDGVAAPNLLDAGVTLSFRARLTPADTNSESTMPNGYGIFSSGKGMFGARQSVPSTIISFSLVNTNEDGDASTTLRFNSAGLTMNRYSGDVPNANGLVGQGVNSSVVAAENPVVPLDPTEFHEFWITIQGNDNTPGNGTHTVHVFMDGSQTPLVFNVTAGTGSDVDALATTWTDYIGMGLNQSSAVGAIDVDFFAYKSGVAIPFSTEPPPSNAPPVIVLQPQNQTVNPGNLGTFTVAASGTAPLRYQWRFNGMPLAGATNLFVAVLNARTAQAGAYDVVVSNAFGAVTSAGALLMVTLELAEAVEAPGSVWNSSGSVQWFGQTNLTFDGVDAAQSGVISDSQVSFIETVVTGPGTLSFRWKVSSQASLDLLTLYLDTAPQLTISGEVEWEQRSFGVSPGRHILSWQYSKDAASAGGQDRAWLDQVSYVGNPVPPVIVVQLQSRTHIVGAPVLLSVTAQSPTPLQYQWSFDGAPLSLATNAVLAIPNVQPGHGGRYSVAVLNAFGAVTSQVATLSVIGPGLTVYQNDFEGTVGAEWSATNASVTPTGARRFLGQFDNQSISLSLTSLPAHTALTVTFDLLLVRSWDGNYFRNGPDVWTLGVGGGPVLLQTSFNNHVPLISASDGGQAYPDAYPGGSHPSLTGATEANTLGYTFPFSHRGTYPSDAVYRMSHTFSHSASALALNFSAAGLSGGLDEGWGLDNVTVHASSTFPAPEILAQPQSANVVAGNNVTLDVTAGGATPLSYQWFLGGVALSGATNATLALSNVLFTSAGNYSVVVSNAFGSVVSVAATLTVLPAAPSYFIYNPARGTLPSAQGFVAMATGTPPSPTVNGGVLRQNTSGNNSLRQSWTSTQAEHGLSFNFSDGFSLEATLKVISSGYNPNTGGGRPRAGYEIYASDNAGRYVSINITSGGLWLDVSGLNIPGGFTPFAAFNATSGFHEYRLVTLGNTATLYVDGQILASIALGADLGERNTIGVGDFTGFVGSQVDLAFLRFSPAALPCVPPPGGLVAWWRGEYNALDSAGTNDGTLQGGATFASGRVGQAFSFDGTNDVVEIPDSPSLSITGAISIEAWIQPDSISGPHNIVSQHDTATAQRAWLFSLRDGRLEFFAAAEGTVSAPHVRYVLTTGPVLTAGVFAHVAATFNPANQDVKLYVNGVAQDTMVDPSSTTVDAIFDSTAPVRIGAVRILSGELAAFFAGRIDEVAIYNRVLTSNEIAAIHAAGSAGLCPPAPLNIGIVGGGTVVKSPDKPAYAYGEGVTLTATAAPHFQFLRWSDGVTDHQRFVVAGLTPPLVALFTNRVPVESGVFKLWDLSFGGTLFDDQPVIQRTSDGGYVLAGWTLSGAGGNKTTELCGIQAAWVVKLDRDGRKQWEQTVGAFGIASSYPVVIVQTSDGGYALGWSFLGGVSAVTGNCGKTSPSHGGFDYWLVRLDANGQRLWDASFGGSLDDILTQVLATSDGGFILVGDSPSGVSGNKSSAAFGQIDLWVVRVDASGNKLWDRTFGGDSDDYGHKGVAQLADGGFLVLGSSASGTVGNKTAAHYGGTDLWLLRLDPAGNKLWDRAYGGNNDDFGIDFTLTRGGDAVLVGESQSSINGNKTTPGFGGRDYWVLRVDADGFKVWDRTYGGADHDSAYAVRETADGGVLVIGEAGSGVTGNKSSASFGGVDGWIVRLDSAGNKLWECPFGGAGYDYLWGVVSADVDGGFTLAGASDSLPGGNKTSPNHGGFDFVVLHVAERIAPVGAPVVYVNNRFHADNMALVTNSALVRIESTFPGGQIRYTLNGAPPSGGALYTGPFALAEAAVVRAIAFRADFAAAAEADAVMIDVVAPPVIVTPPQGRVVGTGADVALNVVAAGTGPLAFQWLRAGVAIPGANDAMLVMTNIQPNQAGNFVVVINNAFGAVTSAPVLVVVFAPPTFLAQPQSVTVGVGGTAMFSVSALGPPPLEFQWRKNGVNIPGATNSMFSITTVTLDDGASYSVVVASPGGTLVSDGARLTVTVPSPPAGDNFASTNTLIGLSGAATGTNNFATREAGEPLHAGKPGTNSVWYTWTAPAKGIATFRTAGSTFDTLLAVYTGTNVGTLTTVVSDEDSGGFLASQVSFNASYGVTYHIAIDGFNGGQGSYVLRWELIVTDETVPEITCPPASRTVPPGDDATFTVSATGSALTYQWLLNGTNIANATNSVYTRTNAKPEHVGFCSVRVTSSSGRTVESAPAILELGPLSGLQSKDKPDDVAAGCPGGFAPATGGASSVAMGSVGYQLLVSVSTNNLIDCNTTNCGGIPRGTRYLELTPAATGTFLLDTIGSASRTKIWVCRAGTNNLDRTRSYLKCDVDSAPDGRSLVSFEVEAGRAYQVWVARLDDVPGDFRLNWRLGLPPRIASLSPSQFAALGSSLSLSVSATNVVASGVTSALTPPSYAWYFNGVHLMATGPTLNLNGLTAAHAGQYVVVVNNDLGATSAVVRVEVFGTAARSVVSEGGVTELFADATTDGCGGAPVRYQWRLNGVPLAGQTNRNLILRGVQATQAGEYTVTVSNCFGTVTYPAATVAVTVDLGFHAERLGGQVILRWQTSPTKHYRVEFRQTLGTGDWFPLGSDIPGTGAIATLTDPMTTLPRFYRIALVD